MCIRDRSWTLQLYGHDFVSSDTQAPTVTPKPTADPSPMPTCPDACDQTFKLFLTTDSYPGETTWSLTSACGSTSGGPYSQQLTEITEEVEVCAGQTYTFEIFDSWGDGGGSYYLELNDDVIYSSDGDFGSGETYEFTVTESPTPHESKISKV